MPQPSSNPSAPTVPRGLRVAGIVVLICAILVVVLGLVQRAHSDSDLTKWTAAQATPTVVLVTPNFQKSAPSLQLPARLEAYTSAPIYARASGYLKAWYVDIGAHVKAGQLMAEIETPDLDQQLAQARADTASADASADLARGTAKRWVAMKGTDAVSQQEIDEKTGDEATKVALSRAAHANLERLVATQGFRRVIAPFDGVVTARGTDVGALINGSTQASGQELFAVADVHKLRAYVQVPQVRVASIRQGQSVELTVPEYPGRIFNAVVDHSARAVSQTSGAMLVQLSVDNADGSLLPGSYAEAHFTMAPGSTASIVIPASALIFDRNGLHVALLDSHDKVVMRPVAIGRDLGQTVEIASGLSATVRVIDSPPDALSDGDSVHLAEAAPAANSAATGKK